MSRVYATVCSGIEAPSVAWSSLGWAPRFFSEIEKFPRAVLQHYWPQVPNLGNMLNYEEWPDYSVDVLCAGTPCQAFSVAGRRKGVVDPRGNLTLSFIGVIERYRPRWVVWENVCGVLSEKTGALACFFGGLEELGYGWAWRVLDAQYFGLAQRRKRVFVIAHSGGLWQRAAAVLFDSESLSGNSPPSREAAQGVARSLTSCLGGCSGKEQQYAFVDTHSEPLNAVVPSVAHTLNAGQRGYGIEETYVGGVASALQERDNKGVDSNVKKKHLIPIRGLGVRRLTPLEYERLQGFPDDFTRIPWRGRAAEQCPAGPRYRALGNSMAVPVLRWIGERIEAVEELATTYKIGG